MTIGVVVLLPFLGVSSLNFGLLATAAFFLAPSLAAVTAERAFPHLAIDPALAAP
ncbi:MULTISPECIES: hypothetical protein [Microvirga]|uniref:hypothetical protein n=1 Tax=Microvirga TaxID=186650 RepID=UPI001CFD3F28|nr:hypothetical protein [Microvirga lenta]MCB5173952.1 hypothetical protein [Microvirga lenta]